ncbi:endo-1,4-beta-xylanase [Rubripirellula reticaptiva]|uniref:endo-1,4-beta-xylanase n=1 Tax=Rubripirellula reticaptiva TaxID=2528013 RepID=A0A5C6FEK4_9BACT|nr:endo-1,4-beta-xylanase [Rubripirellula reticaptiva]TWU58011.1 Exoglucanase/xylanase precursor [Rubripirellula reticaptiva]
MSNVSRHRRVKKHCSTIKRHSIRLEKLEDRRLLAIDSFAGSGITAQYFADIDLQQIVATNVESSITQDWAASAPVAGLNVDAFSVRMTGQVEASFTEPHAFALSADGGARLWINGVAVIDNWDSSTTNETSTVNLISGRRYEIKLEYRETGGDANVSLNWSSPSLPLQPIAPAQLFATELGSIQNRVWDVDPAVPASNWLTGYPSDPDDLGQIPSLQVTSSSTSATIGSSSALLHVPVTGDYQFFVAGDGLAQVWLSNTESPDAKQLIASLPASSAAQQWTLTPQQQSDPVQLVAGQAYAIELVYQSGQSSGPIAVGWTQPGSETVEVLDGQFLSPPLPTVRVFASGGQVSEGAVAPVEFVVHRTGQPTNDPIVVSYSLRGDATPGVDYAGTASGLVTIPAGATSATVSINPVSDSLSEGTESIIFEVVDSAGYDVGFISERRAEAIISDDVEPPTGTLVVSPAVPLTNYAKFGGNFTSITPTAPFTNVIEAAIPTVTGSQFDSQLRFGNLQGFQTGDVMLADFYVRSIGGVGKITAIAETDGQPYDHSLDHSIDVPTQWTRIQVPFTIARPYDSTTTPMAFGFILGSKPQTIQFADIHLYAYGAPRDVTPANVQLVNGGSGFGSTTSVSVTNQPFETAKQIQTVTTPTGGDPPSAEPWRFQYGGRNSGPVGSGDNLEFDFYARSVAGANPRINAVIQTTTDFATLSSQLIQPTSSWQKYTIMATATADFAIEGLQAMLNLGFDPQTVEVADLRWTNVSATANLNELPSMSPSISYVGRDAEDSWRDSAVDDIVANRQSELTVHVIDALGNPVEGAVVSIQQASHAFRFGSAIDSLGGQLDPNTVNADFQTYQSEITRLFNTAVIENSLKWPQLESNRARAIEVANWAVNSGLYLRGHNAVWPGADNLPASVWNTYQTTLAAGDSANAENYLRQAIATHIEDVATTFASVTGEWDVVNEPFTNTDAIEALGAGVVLDWFNLFRQYDPTGDRVLNDYDIFANNGNNAAHRANFDSWLQTLTAANAIERIGEQSHYTDGNLTDIAVFGALIDTYHTTFNLPIAITEFDITSQDRQLQADYLRDYMTIAFSKSAIDEFIHWGFWSEAHWRPDGAMYNADFSIRPHGQVYEDLVFGSWWTDTRGTTRGDGNVAADVFRGDYEITVTYNNQTVTRSLSDFSTDGTLVFALPGVVWSTPVLSGSEGNASNVTAVLTHAPTSDVTVTIAPSTQVTTSPSTLTFTFQNWDTPQPVTITPIEDYSIEGNQSETLSVTVVSDDSEFDGSSTLSPRIDFTDGQSPLGVQSVTIGADNTSRSVVRQVEVDFDGLATVDPSAFTVDRISDGQSTSSVPLQVNTVDVLDQGVPQRTRVVLTFLSAITGTTTVNQYGGLENGDYRITIDSSLVTKRNTVAMLDGDGNGSSGGNYSLGDNPLDRFYSLYGDVDGDGIVGVTDFIQFRNSYAKSPGQNGYNAGFSYDLDGLIGVAEYIRFRSTYGKSR